MKIEGYIPIKKVSDKQYFFSKKKNKFVDTVDELYMSDLFINKLAIENSFLKIDNYEEIVKITINIEL